MVKKQSETASNQICRNLRKKPLLIMIATSFVFKFVYLKKESFAMFPHQNKLLAICAALTLSACATQQNPAPVVSGTDTSIYTPSTTPTIDTSSTVSTSTNNPYGATPYDPNVNVPTNTSTTTPVVSDSSNMTNTMGTAPRQPYVGNYSPVDKSASVHTVTSGDTVYNISKRYGISQADLRAWNNIGEDNAIHLGQTLRVKPTSTVSTTPVTPPPATSNQVVTNASTPVVSGSTKTVSGITWQSPTNGKLIQPFGNGNNGMQIGGTRGQPVVAAADGQVVYSGSGLRGYGNLVIIQHNNTYLTAYGHNESPLLVKEGERVKRGQQIAKMGSSDSSSGVKLHFELRENGTPVNPARFVDIN